MELETVEVGDFGLEVSFSCRGGRGGGRGGVGSSVEE